MGSVLVYIPYLLAAGGATGGWHFGAWRYLGLLPLGAGIAGIARCLRDFAVVGRGTPAPFDPPRELVATGLYRWVRNPMYLSALLLLVGEATACALSGDVPRAPSPSATASRAGRRGIQRGTVAR